MRAATGGEGGLWHHGAPHRAPGLELSSFMLNAMPSTLRLVSTDTGSLSPAMA
jgi:hypothetical protein